MDQNCIRSLLQSDVRVPVTTYRAQMHREFTYDQAAGIVPYLQRLGMGDFYASPIFEARPGSMHGYDVTRHDRLNPELGGAEQGLRPRFPIVWCLSLRRFKHAAGRSSILLAHQDLKPAKGPGQEAKELK